MLPVRYSAWVRHVGDPPDLYHYVPNGFAQATTCGLPVRECQPRIGVRMEDRHCAECTKAAMDDDRKTATR